MPLQWLENIVGNAGVCPSSMSWATKTNHFYEVLIFSFWKPHPGQAD